MESNEMTTGVRRMDTSYEVATATRTGLRDTNADAVLVDEAAGLFAVSDGMCDTPASGVAANTVLQAVGELFLEPWTTINPAERSLKEAEGRLYLGIVQAHRRILAPSRPRRERIGATFAGVVACGGFLCVGHVGDSRSYIVRPYKGTMARLTEDHTVLVRRIQQGMQRDEAVKQPDAHQLTQVLGVNRTIKLATSVQRWEPGDIVLLCTDGVSDQIDKRVIADIVFDARDLVTAAQDLVDLATAGTGLDNSTVILVRRAR